MKRWEEGRRIILLVAVSEEGNLKVGLRVPKNMVCIFCYSKRTSTNTPTLISQGLLHECWCRKSAGRRQWVCMHGRSACPEHCAENISPLYFCWDLLVET
jgi:hypothetical protein